MKIVSLTDIGLVRKSNEDSYKVGSLSKNVAWAIVCDGMGGANGGNVASHMAVDVLTKGLDFSYCEDMSDEAIKNMLISAAYNSNSILYETASRNDFLKGMGTTLILALVVNDVIHLVSAGDSRAYLITKTEVTQITRDHSIVQDMVERGEITKDEAQNHPQKNIITRALGVDQFINVDYYEITFDPDNILFICTDGFSNYVSNEKLFEISHSVKFDCLAKECVNFAKQCGGGDNITVVAISK